MILRKTRARVADPHRPPPPDPSAGDPDTALLACAGNVAGEHVLVLGHSAPEVMYGLIRRGCLAATEMRQNERPEAATVDLAIVPDLGTLADADIVIRHARRALLTTGRILLRTPTEKSGRLALGISRLLRLQGFSAIRLRHAGAHVLVSAELPWFGPQMRF